MEPRPQRPRAQPGQANQHTRQAPPPQDPQAYQADYPLGADPTAFVAPPRTEYDYSPLDLAPPGQRRRRQLVAAVIGGLSVLLLGAIIFFAYLLLREEETPSQNDDLLAAQTQVANDAATVAANQTVVAQAAADQTAQAGGEESAPAENAAATEEAEQTEPAGSDEPAGETPAAEQTPAARGDGEETPNAPDLSGNGSNAALDEAGLIELLPAEDQVPAGLTSVEDTTRTQEQVLESLGGGRPAEANLAEWGWSGNVERAFENPDPAAADPATTTYLSVSVHGFGGSEEAGEALPFYAEILVASGAGYAEVDAPDVGDGAQMFAVNPETGGTWITLYVQDGSVLYRIFASSPQGDPTEDAIAVANELIGG